MSTSQSQADYFLDQISGAGDVRIRKMFGEYAVYCDNKVVALICDDLLYVKITSLSNQFLSSEHEAPPYPKAKNYLLVPEEYWEDREWLSSFIRKTAEALPLPKSKKSV